MPRLGVGERESICDAGHAVANEEYVFVCVGRDEGDCDLETNPAAELVVGR